VGCYLRRGFASVSSGGILGWLGNGCGCCVGHVSFLVRHCIGPSPSDPHAQILVVLQRHTRHQVELHSDTWVTVRRWCHRLAAGSSAALGWLVRRVVFYTVRLCLLLASPSQATEVASVARHIASRVVGTPGKNLHRVWSSLNIVRSEPSTAQSLRHMFTFSSVLFAYSG
jgi:hypothetical protein